MKRRFVSLAIAACLALVASLAVAAALPPLAPLPEKFKNKQVIKPAPTIPKDEAELLGEWEGNWKYIGDMRDARGLNFGQEVRRAKLIVYEAPSPGKIKFLFGIGDSPYLTISGGWWDNESDIQEKDGKKYFSRISQSAGGSGFGMQFHLENGVMKGGQGKNWEIELKRVK
jgi:hypothetical protein